ncbi:MAG: prepilin-type N-terminal cleavage/methylation domain-containing protein [Armatimonadota bacterium]
MKSRRGASLVEAMVAVVLLAVGISASVACIGTATEASGRSEEYTAVQLLAREKLSELELQPVQVGPQQGDFGEQRPGYRWETLTEETETPGLNRVRLRILWGDPERPKQEEFLTFTRSR